jgi:hypothetical protein
MDINEARSNQFSGGINFFSGFTDDGGSNLHNAAISYSNIGDSCRRTSSVDNCAPAN